jgi:hypothetical protein
VQETAMSKTTWKWEKAQWLEPRGHRVFRDARDAFKAPELRAWAIADNSGSTPDRTDDGVLWLDMSRPLRVSVEQEYGMMVSIPVRCECGGMRVGWTGTGIGGLIVLRRLFPAWKVEVSGQTRRLLIALAPEATGLLLKAAGLLLEAATEGAYDTALVGHPAQGTEREIAKAWEES